MKTLYNSILLVLALQCATAYTQKLPKPEIHVEAYIFKDSTLVSAVTDHTDGILMVEKNPGSQLVFKTYTEPFYVTESKSIRFKLVHPDYEDSDVVLVELHKTSDLEVQIQGEKLNLSDLKRGTTDLEGESWLRSNTKKILIQFSTQNKKLEEVELLSYVHTAKGILPPKKVVLYAHLKNGQKVHIRTSNTIGKFKNQEQYWSHTLRLLGKPKLKKLLRKTSYFSLEITPHFQKNDPQWLYLDELLVR